MSESDAPPEQPSDFIRDMIRADVAAGKHGGAVVTRFPPEPNGWLHIGHAKSICLNYGVAKELGGRCNLRMDDTNPTTESMDYVRAIEADVAWLVGEPIERVLFASDYFERFYELAERLVTLGRAYVCDLPDEEFGASYRGTITEAGKESPYRSRTVAENLDLLRRMRAGEMPDGARVLRAKIDMASPNMKMRDPPLVRIKHAHHYRTGDAWCIYPLYDFAHCLEDSFEGVTHSLCTMEFESARELYDWVIAATEVPHVPRQTEFAKLQLTYVLLSKRRLLQLVNDRHVSGWDDPRMPTIAGLRRRGYTAESIRAMCQKVGVARNLSRVDIALFEACAREDLDAKSPRVMCVQRPLELVVESFPEREVIELDAPYWPDGPSAQTRPLPFSRVLYIEEDDFAENAPKGFHRMTPGREVRLRHAFIVTCTGVEKDASGKVVRVKCTHDPATQGGAARAGKRVDGTIHWVSAAHAKDLEVRLYDRLFSVEAPGDGDRDWTLDLNPRSLEVVRAKAEPSLATAKGGDRFQFERVGFFFADPTDSKPGAPVFNRTVALKDSWAKQAAPAKAPPAPKAEPAKTHAPSAAAELSEAASALRDAHGVSGDEARVLENEAALRAIFDAVSAGDKKEAATLLANDVLGVMRAHKLDALPFGAPELEGVIALVRAGEISKKQAKEILAEMVTTGKLPRVIIVERGMKQVADAGAIEPFVDAVLSENEDAVLRFKAGNANVMGALVGLVMKKSHGQANPKIVADLLKKKLAP